MEHDCGGGLVCGECFEMKRRDFVNCELKVDRSLKYF